MRLDFVASSNYCAFIMLPLYDASHVNEFFIWIHLLWSFLCFIFQIAVQSVASARENRISKKGRRGAEYTPVRFACSTF